MESDSQETARLIRSGAYFEQARAWYEAIYIGPISERTFFLIIAILAGVIAFFGFLSVMMFLPLTDRTPILVRNERMDEAIPYVLPLSEKGTAVNESLMRFYVANYIDKREGYAEEIYDANRNFILAQSDPATFTDYSARYDKSNRQSVAAILGKIGKRVVAIDSVDIKPGASPKQATVRFSTEIQGFSEVARTSWTAVLQFNYTDLLVVTSKDPATGEEVLTTQDPQFQVISYALTQVSK